MAVYSKYVVGLTCKKACPDLHTLPTAGVEPHALHPDATREFANRMWSCVRHEWFFPPAAQPGVWNHRKP